MKKALLFGVVGILLVIVIASTVVVLRFDAMVKAGIETYGPEVTGTPVTVQAVQLSLLGGEGRVKGLVIGNPKGYQSPSAFKLGDARVKVSLASVLTDKVIIEEIVVEAPDVMYEVTPAGSNIAQIQQHVGAFRKAPAGGPVAQPSPSGSQKKLQINNFIVRNGRVNASAVGRTVMLPLSDIHLKDIGKPHGMTPENASAEVLAAMNRAALQTVSANSGKILSQGADVLKDIGSGTDKSGSKALEDVKGLFGK